MPFRVVFRGLSWIVKQQIFALFRYVAQVFQSVFVIHVLMFLVCKINSAGFMPDFGA